MKRILFLLLATALTFTSCSDYDDDIDSINDRLDAIEGTTLPTVADQVASIQASLPALQSTSDELKGYITALQSKATQLEQTLTSTQQQLNAVQEQLNNYTNNDAELAALATSLESLQTTVSEELASLEVTIAALQGKDVELEQKIADLQSYVDEQLKTAGDELKAWVETTYATLEQYNSLTEEIAGVKQMIETTNASITELESRINTKIATDIAAAVEALKGEMSAEVAAKVAELTTAYTEAIATAVATAKEEITAAYTAAIQSAITALENSMKSWVSEQLAGYYTIAQIDAKLTALETQLLAAIAAGDQTVMEQFAAGDATLKALIEQYNTELLAKISSGDAALLEQINNIRKDLDLPEVDMSSTYQQAIADAITANNGVIDGKIAAEVSTINNRITNEVAALNAKIAEVEARIGNLEAQIEALVGRIQSVSYIPTHNDGKATVYVSEMAGTKTVTFDFMISPASAATELKAAFDEKSRTVQMNYVPTETRAVSFLSLGLITSLEVTNRNRGIITVGVDAYGLQDAFVNGEAGASAVMMISDGNNSRTSEYIELVPEKVTIPNNEIWYKTSDEQAVTLSMDLFVTSNTYAGGWGRLVLSEEVVNPYDWFLNCTTLTEVILPATAERLPSFSGCTALTKVEWPNANIITIPANTFAGCTALTSFTLPETLTGVPYNAFADSSIEKLEGKYATADGQGVVIDGTLYAMLPSDRTAYTIPEGVKVLGSSLFANNTTLTSVVLPNTVEEIGSGAFNGCSALKSISLPASLKVIGSGAFNGCTALEKFEGDCPMITADGRGLMSEGNVLASYLLGAETELTIPAGVKELAQSLFDSNTTLKTVTIPATVETIGQYAFRKCSALETVTIAEGVKTIGSYAFSQTALTAIAIPASVETINSNAFSNCTALASVSIAEGVKTIGNSVFQQCTALTEVTVPASVESFGRYLFRQCTSLKSATVLCKTAGDAAFRQCTALESVTLSANVTTIDRDFCYRCTALKTVYCPATTVPLLNSTTSFPKNEGMQIFVPEANVEDYKAAGVWSSYANYIVGHAF